MRASAREVGVSFDDCEVDAGCSGVMRCVKCYVIPSIDDYGLDCVGEYISTLRFSFLMKDPDPNLRHSLWSGPLHLFQPHLTPHWNP